MIIRFIKYLAGYRTAEPASKEESKKLSLTPNELEIIELIDYKETALPFEERKEILKEELTKLKNEINRLNTNWATDIDRIQAVTAFIKEMWDATQFILSSQVLKNYILGATSALERNDIKEFNRRVEVLAGGKMHEN